ncbi:MAG: hypothetical protein GT601_09620 [Acidaminobacter sp.]|uniref:hypothetical protein n=1 Tax=Acidaminobacter sp. TaxID=1872102 RepID=UPI0013812DB6|nr:hypothetical protein [Acidaminobacter sp.]MZQ97927.1 hypothetical protein [Acidaminobacter sp.]
MSEAFMELFDIKEVFEQNSRQRILMGTPKRSPDEIVVINRFYRDETFNESLYLLLKRSLKNLVHIENTATELVVVTAYPEGAPLTALIESPRLLPSDRMKLAEFYLDQAAAYEGLPPAIQSLLIDLNQFVVQDTGLEPKELIVLDRGFKPELEPSAVTKKLSGVLNHILKPNEAAYEEFETDGIRNLIAGLAVGAISSISAARGTFAGLMASSERVSGTIHTTTSEKAGSNAGVSVPGAAVAGASVAGARVTRASENSVNTHPENSRSETDGNATSSIAAGSAVLGAAAAGAAAFGASAGGATAEGTGTTTLRSAGQGPGTSSGDSRTGAVGIELDNLFISEEPAKRTSPPRKKTVKKRQFKWIAWLLLIAVACLVLFGIFNILTGLFVRKAPVARFETQIDNGTYHFINKSSVSGSDNKLTQISWRIEKDGTELLSSDEFDLTVSFKNAGKYKVTLMVKDRYRWSSAYSQVMEHELAEGASIPSGEGEPVTVSEADDPLSGIQTSNVSANVSYDEKISRTGTASLKLDMTNTDQAQLSLDGLNVNRSTALSFWMKSSETDRVILTVFGYNDNGLKFTKKLTLMPQSTSNWEMVTIQSNYDGITAMKLQFSAPGTILWLDNFELAAFK